MNTLTYESPLGRLLLLASGHGLAGVYFDKHKHLRRDPAWVDAAQDTLLCQARTELAEYFAGQRRAFDVPLDQRAGTAFQQAVWRALRQLPFGSTCSYAALARQIGRPTAVRAVAAANGRNPLSIMIPCHRVIGSSGALTGYAGGLANKQALLDLEQRL